MNKNYSKILSDWLILVKIIKVQHKRAEIWIKWGFKVNARKSLSDWLSFSPIIARYTVLLLSQIDYQSLVMNLWMSLWPITHYSWLMTHNLWQSASYLITGFKIIYFPGIPEFNKNRKFLSWSWLKSCVTWLQTILLSHCESRNIAESSVAVKNCWGHRLGRFILKQIATLSSC